MTVLCDCSAYVDFTSPLALHALGRVLSERLFAGISFVGENEGIWDEVPALRLERDFLGLRVELGGTSGGEGGFTLQIEPVIFPWHQINAAGVTGTVDFSNYLRFLLVLLCQNRS